MTGDADTTETLGAAIDLVADRWTLRITAALLDGPARFGDLQRRLEGIAPNVLTQRLRVMQDAGLVTAERYSSRPVRMVYELTPRGRDLEDVLRQLAGWGARHGGIGEGPRHDLCGTPLESRWWCPTCERPVDDPAEDLLHL